jgi:hypothetical protein
VGRVPGTRLRRCRAIDGPKKELAAQSSVRHG